MIKVWSLGCGDVFAVSRCETGGFPEGALSRPARPPKEIGHAQQVEKRPPCCHHGGQEETGLSTVGGSLDTTRAQGPSHRPSKLDRERERGNRDGKIDTMRTAYNTFTIPQELGVTSGICN